MNTTLKNKPIIIHIHSFVDLITNSSTEIYVGATSKTVDTAYELIDNLFKTANSPLKGREVFDIQLQTSGYVNDEDVTNTHATYEEASQFVEDINNNGGSVQIDRTLAISLKEGYTDNPSAKAAAKILKDLSSSYDITEQENY